MLLRPLEGRTNTRLALRFLNDKMKIPNLPAVFSNLGILKAAKKQKQSKIPLVQEFIHETMWRFLKLRYKPKLPI